MNKTSKEAVLDVFAGLMRPLMPVAYEYGISAAEVSGVVRRSYIESLETRLREQQRPTTDARLATVTGLPKADVIALREAMRIGAAHSMRAAESMDQIANLLTTWHTHSNFSGAYGLAMDLDLLPGAGSPRRSFGELVDVACPDADRDVLLDDLIAAGSIEIVDNSTVRCLSRAYVPRGADVTQIERMGRFLGIVTGNFVHNVLRAANEPAWFERAVVSDEPLTDEGRDQFQAIAGERGQELLADLDTFLTGLTTSKRATSGKRYGVGVYFFEENSTQYPAMREGKEHFDGRSGDRENGPVQEIDILANIGRKE